MTQSLTLNTVPAGVRLDIRVIPRSPRSGIDGVRGGRLLVRVTAPPVDDAANAAVVELLARTLKVSRSAVRIVTGASGRNKAVEVSGVDAAMVRARLSI